MKNVLNKVKIVAVDLKYPMNIGSLARTMDCCGYKDLALVRPCAGWKNMDAVKFSLFGKHVLDSARIYNDLSELKGKNKVLFGFSRRIGKKRNRPIMLTDLVPYINKFYPTKDLVFVLGVESSGLSTDDISVCDHIVTIDTDVVNNYLSLPTAGAIILYEFRRGLAIKERSETLKHHKHDAGQAGVLLERIRELLKKIGFIDNRDKKRVLAKINDIITRLSTSEIKLLHAILKKEEDGKKNKGSKLER